MSAMHHNVLTACRGLDRASEESVIGPPLVLGCWPVFKRDVWIAR